MFRNDVATGKVDLTETGNYQTKGKLDVRDVRNELPASTENICYVLQPAGTCTEEQKTALVNGTAETKDWVVTSPKGEKGGEEGKKNDSDTEESKNGKDGDVNSNVAMGLSYSLGLAVTFVGGVVVLLEV
jgi:hypothetical protein